MSELSASTLTNMWAFTETFSALLGHPEVPECEGRVPSVSKISVSGTEDLDLIALCQKYCETNRTAGVDAKILKIFLHQVDPESPLAATLFVALQTFVERYTYEKEVLVRRRGIRRWIGRKNRSGGSLTPLILTALFVLVRFHRPHVANAIEELNLIDRVWDLLGTCCLSCVDNGLVGRDLLLKVSSSGEPLAALFMIISILERIFAESSVSSAAEFDARLANFRIENPSEFSSLWNTACAIANDTPSGTVVDSTEYRMDERSTNAPPLVLRVSVRSVFEQLLKGWEDLADPRPDREGRDGRESVEQVSDIAGGAFSLARGAGTADQPYQSNPAWMIIDARSADERELDWTPVVLNQPKGLRKSRSPASDWWNDKSSISRSTSNHSQNSSKSSSGTSTPEVSLIKCVRLRRAQCLYVEHDMEETALRLILQKLEFSRNATLCLVGSNRDSILRHLIDREFPRVCVMEGSFGDLRNVAMEDQNVAQLNQLFICERVVPESALAIQPTEQFPSYSISEEDFADIDFA